MKAPTVKEKARWQKFHRIGCIACLKDGISNTGFDIHHLINGYRVGHHATIPLCPWHHRGQMIYIPPGALTEAQLHKDMPSLAKSKRDFVAKYGTEEELLAEVNELIGEA